MSSKKKTGASEQQLAMKMRQVLSQAEPQGVVQGDSEGGVIRPGASPFPLWLSAWDTQSLQCLRLWDGSRGATAQPPTRK